MLLSFFSSSFAIEHSAKSYLSHSGCFLTNIDMPIENWKLIIKQKTVTRTGFLARIRSEKRNGNT